MASSPDEVAPNLFPANGFPKSDRQGSHSQTLPNRIDAPPGNDSSPRASVIVIDPSPLSLIATAGVMDANGYTCVCGRTAKAAVEALQMGPQDLIVWDVGNDATTALSDLAKIRDVQGYQSIPAVLLADPKWSGLEKRIEALTTTRCLFKPIDHQSLIAVAEALLWVPGMVDAHRRRGSRPSRPGWVTL